MSDFSTLTTKLVTPLLQDRGFKKVGEFDRGSTHDSAIYRRGALEVELTFAFHPYDYPELGIRLRVRDATGVLFDRLHPPAEGGTEAILQEVIRDIKSGAGGV